MRKKIGTIALVVSLILSMTACAPSEKRYEASFLELFDTVTTVVGYAKDEETFTEYTQMIYDYMEEYHQLYDIYHDYEGINNIKTINDNAGILPVKVDQKIIDLLLESKEIEKITNHKMNVAYGAVLKVWHDYRTEGIESPEMAKLPPLEMLREMSEHTNMNEIVINEEDSTVFLSDPEMSLDVGAIAKGYATEMTANYIEEQGFENGMISVGGNVRTIGHKVGEGGEALAWNVGIQNPEVESEMTTIHILELQDMSLVTSGVYERYYTVDGKQYHHIIDPSTLLPSEEYQSVSIVCQDSGRADAFSTAVFNMSLEEGKQLIESQKDTEAFWILNDGSFVYSSGFEQFIKE